MTDKATINLIATTGSVDQHLELPHLLSHLRSTTIGKALKIHFRGTLSREHKD